MKLASLAAAALAFVLPTFAQTEVCLTYDTIYDNPSLPLTDFACPIGAHGPIPGYPTLGSLPTWPNVGGAYIVTGWNSPECGTCYEITYGNETIYVLVVNTALDCITLSEEAMNMLTGGLAVEYGRIEATALQVNVSYCGL